MANYSDIRGYRVKYLSSDPTLNTSTEGQVWYNSILGTLKGLVQIKAWSSSANVPTDIRNHMGTGPSTAGVLFGGYNPPATAITTALEYYGYSYSTGGTVNTPSRQLAGSGASQTSALKIMGQTEPFSIDVGITNTESYDGSTWTTVNPANTKRFSIGGSGTQTSSIVLGGRDDPANRGTSFEEWDGTSWATGTSPPLSKNNTGVWGDSNAALVFGGNTPALPPGTNQKTAQDWNGTAWTSVSDMINRAFNNASNCGDSGSGVNANSTGSEEWDGQTWSTIPAMTSARNGCGGGDNSNIWIGGAPPGTNLTEEYNSNINTITASSWASGGNLNTARSFYNASADLGTQTAGLGFGGYKFPPSAGRTNVESYDGSTWSNETAIPSTTYLAGGAGTQTSALMFGGSLVAPSSTGRQSTTFEYNGASWTSGGALNEAKLANDRGAGSQTAALCGDGSGSLTEHYDGTSWATVTSAPENVVISGPQTATLGSGPSGATFYYDGSTWTAQPASLNINLPGSSIVGGVNAQTHALKVGGNPAPGSTNVERWNGTSWISDTSTSGNKRSVGSATDLVFGGGGGPVATAATEEFTQGTETVTASTLTTS